MLLLNYWYFLPLFFCASFHPIDASSILIFLFAFPFLFSLIFYSFLFLISYLPSYRWYLRICTLSAILNRCRTKIYQKAKTLKLSFTYFLAVWFDSFIDTIKYLSNIGTPATAEKPRRGRRSSACLSEKVNIIKCLSYPIRLELDFLRKVVK